MTYDYTMKGEGSVLLGLDHGFKAEVLVPSEDADYGDLYNADHGQCFDALVLLVENQVFFLPCYFRPARHLLQCHLQPP